MAESERLLPLHCRRFSSYFPPPRWRQLPRSRRRAPLSKLLPGGQWLEHRQGSAFFSARTFRHLSTLNLLDDKHIHSGGVAMATTNCLACKGTGRCAKCDGSGKDYSKVFSTPVCPLCKGEATCLRCGGTGKD